MGNRTPDHQIAQELYKALSDLGDRVFFSSKTPEKIGSSRYKADIDEALDSAKVMAVILTSGIRIVPLGTVRVGQFIYNDSLSGIRKEANLYSLTSEVNIHDLLASDFLCCKKSGSVLLLTGRTAAIWVFLITTPKKQGAVS